MAPSEAVTRLRQLITKASVTPHAGDALDLVEDWLKAKGFTCHRLVFSEPGHETVENLYARAGTGAPHFCFAGHLDVVPTGPEAAWSVPPFAGEIVGGDIVGRGAEDMKGGVAAFLTAAFDFLADNADFGGSISLLLTGDEEGPAINGTVKVLDWMAENGEIPDHRLVGEPTNIDRLGDVAKIGRRGSLNGRVRVRGTQGHTAYPHRADNPIPKLLPLIEALLAPLDEGTRHFEPSNLQVTAIETGNPATNIIPGEVTARFNCRFNDTWTAASLETELRQRLDGAAAGCAPDYAPDYVIETDTNAESFVTEEGAFTDLVAAAITEATGIVPELTTGGGTSDARFVTRHCPVIEFGLVGRTMHQVDERVPVGELEALVHAYALILRRYFDQGRPA